jgi:leader peptidase (prepilin peptidase)/N-methyltransferase
MTPTVGHRIAAAVGGLTGCVLAAVGEPAWAAVAIVVGVAVGVVPADLRERRIPTPLVLIGALGGLAAIVITVVADETSSPIIHAVAGAVIVGGAFLLVHLVQPAGLGFGDVRLAALIGGLVAYGAASIPAAVATAAIAAVAAALTTVVARSKSAAFAPYLLGVALAALVISAIR